MLHVVIDAKDKWASLARLQPAPTPFLGSLRVNILAPGAMGVLRKRMDRSLSGGVKINCTDSFSHVSEGNACGNFAMAAHASEVMNQGSSNAKDETCRDR